MSKPIKTVNVSRIDESRSMLRQYLDDETLGPLLNVLDEMIKAPSDQRLQEQLATTFDDLGMIQGAVLTYAPYIAILLAEDRIPDHDWPAPQ